MPENNTMSESEKKRDDWMNTKWRPMMGWTYMATCIFDFVIFPILWSIIQAWGDGKVEMQWQPLTLQGAGLFHIAMGAILGIAVYGRTKEKLNGSASGFELPPNVGTTYIPPGQNNNSFPLYQTSTPRYNTQGYSSGSPTIENQNVFIYKGKPGPIQPPEPEL